MTTPLLTTAPSGAATTGAPVTFQRSTDDDVAGAAEQPTIDSAVRTDCEIRSRFMVRASEATPFAYRLGQRPRPC